MVGRGMILQKLIECGKKVHFEQCSAFPKLANMSIQ